MLYENVVLESSKQVAAFLSAFRFKPAEFRTVKAVRILDSEPRRALTFIPYIQHMPFIGKICLPRF